jgi:peroxiredoxin
MARIALAVSTIVFTLFSQTALAGKYNQVLNIGDPAPVWKGLAGVDDESHSLDELSSKKVIVVVFTCNSCPYAVDAEDRLIELHKKYSGRGVALVAINVNKVEEDLLPAMKEKAKEKGFEFPYLFDGTQQIAKDYGAIVTPECYVLDSERNIRYMGSIDDSPDGKQIQNKYLESAIDAVLAGGKPEITETVPIGCQVRFERQRSSRRRSAENE